MFFMPQLSIYLDDNTLAQVRESAKKSDISVSKLITNALGEYMSNQWPDGFDTLFGSISDDTFQRHPGIQFTSDLKRKSFELLS